MIAKGCVSAVTSSPGQRMGAAAHRVVEVGLQVWKGARRDFSVQPVSGTPFLPPVYGWMEEVN